MPGSYLRGRLPLPDGIDLIDRAHHAGRISSRGFDKVLRLSWTLADLGGLAKPGTTEVRTALALRRGDLDELGGRTERKRGLVVVEGRR